MVRRSNEGFGERRRASNERLRQLNLKETRPTLEGPGSEERLALLQEKFQALHAPVAAPPWKFPLLVFLAFVLTFLAAFIGAEALVPLNK